MTRFCGYSSGRHAARCVLSFAVLLAGAACFAEGGEGATPLRFAETGRTLVVARAQMKYGLDRNYLGRWVDRPLFQDSSLREDHSGCVTPYSSFRRVVKITKSYGLDGLAFFPETSQRMCIFDYVQRAEEPGCVVLPEFSASKDTEKKYALLDAALKNSAVAMIGGRILITGYRTDSLELTEWNTMLTAFREKYGEAFIFMPDISYPAGQGWLDWSKRFNSDRPPTAEETEAIKTYLRVNFDSAEMISKTARYAYRLRNWQSIRS